MDEGTQIIMMGIALLVAYFFAFFGMYLAYRAYKKNIVAKDMAEKVNEMESEAN